MPFMAQKCSDKTKFHRNKRIHWKSALITQMFSESFFSLFPAAENLRVFISRPPLSASRCQIILHCQGPFFN